MSVQSLSIMVPVQGRCVNNCAFCVSRMRDEKIVSQLQNLPFYDLYVKDYVRLLDYARGQGCNTVLITGTTEPQQNIPFLKELGLFFRLMKNPFERVEIQSSGAYVDERMLRFLRNHLGVKVFALSLSSFDDEKNSMINGMRPGAFRNTIEGFCGLVKKYDFTLRISLNLNKASYDEPATTIAKAKALGADQLTFRILYQSGNDTEQDRWIRKNTSPFIDERYSRYVKTSGKMLERLPYGLVRYSIGGLSVVVDDDCMSQHVAEDARYYVLKPDCHLYTRWDDPASRVL